MMSAWSYTALTSFETCPRKHYLTRVSREVVEPESEVLRWGNSVHKALENKIKADTPLPTGMEQWDKIVTKLLNVEGDVFTEQQLALNEQLQPTGWFDKDVWVRGVIDAGVDAGKKVLALDWKTGKVKPDSDQLKLFAALVLHHKPAAEKVLTGFVWLAHGRTTTATYSRADLPGIWNDFLPRVKRLDRAFEENAWPAKPSGLCRGWCPCTGCEFNGRKG
jgi:hypothetical protein